jgi:hypothetical protein
MIMMISRMVLRREIASIFLPFCQSRYNPTKPNAIAITIMKGKEIAKATANAISHMNDFFVSSGYL